MKKIFFYLITAAILFTCFAPEPFVRKQYKKIPIEKNFLELPLAQMENDLSLVRVVVRENQKALDFLKDKEIFVYLIESQGGKWDEASEIQYTSCLIKISNALVSLASQEAIFQRHVDGIREKIRKLSMPEI